MRDRFVHKTPRKKVGILGGSFNPAHAGHRHISRQALKLLGLDEVWWLVAPLNPFKQSEDMAAYDDRLAAARREAARDENIVVSDFERRAGTRYSYDTVVCLKKTYPDIDFVWLVGADILQELHRWHKYDALMHLLPVAVFARKNYALKGLRAPAARRFAVYRIDAEHGRRLAEMKPPAWVFLNIRRHGASSTEIRRRQALSDGEKG